jgi:hypothetical protein
LNVKIDIQVLTYALPGFKIKRRGPKTIIDINNGQIVLTLKPP